MLVVAPWTGNWEQNFFAQTRPWLQTLMANPFVRGGVTGIGMVTAVAGLRDLRFAIQRRPAPRVETTANPRPPAQ